MDLITVNAIQKKLLQNLDDLYQYLLELKAQREEEARQQAQLSLDESSTPTEKEVKKRKER